MLRDHGTQELVVPDADLLVTKPEATEEEHHEPADEDAVETLLREHIAHDKDHDQPHRSDYSRLVQAVSIITDRFSPLHFARTHPSPVECATDVESYR